MGELRVDRVEICCDGVEALRFGAGVGTSSCRHASVDVTDKARNLLLDVAGVSVDERDLARGGLESECLLTSGRRHEYSCRRECLSALLDPSVVSERAPAASAVAG